MSNAGYGNHEAGRPSSDKNVKVADTKEADAEASGAKPAGAMAHGSAGHGSGEDPDRAKTPGTGALPDDPQGREVDPGSG